MVNTRSQAAHERQVSEAHVSEALIEGVNVASWAPDAMEYFIHLHKTNRHRELRLELAALPEVEPSEIDGSLRKLREILTWKCNELSMKTTGSIETKIERLANMSILPNIFARGGIWKKGPNNTWTHPIIVGRGKTAMIVKDIALLLGHQYSTFGRNYFTPLEDIYRFLEPKWFPIGVRIGIISRRPGDYKHRGCFRGAMRCALQDHGYIDATNYRGGNLNTPQVSRRMQVTGTVRPTFAFLDSKLADSGILFLSREGENGWKYMPGSERIEIVRRRRED
jgi:hypothetical protein